MDSSDKVEAYYNTAHPFQKGVGTLRALVLGTELGETFKWGSPTYTLKGKNVLSIVKFKHRFGVWFFNGVFLSDPQKVLENAQEGKTQAMRHWKFQSNEDIDQRTFLAYVNEAIINEKKGIKLSPRSRSQKKTTIPEMLSNALDKSPATKKAFIALSPYKQRDYAEYIAEAKQERTEITRLEKILPMILEGKGLNDKYR